MTGNLPIDDRLAYIIDRALALDRLERLYGDLPHPLPPAEFLARILAALRVGCEIDERALERIPSSGPLILVANHPFGGIEGLVLASRLLARRPDLKLLANSLLGRLPDLAPMLIGVNPFGGREAVRQNVSPLREAMRWVRAGASLLVFPSGEVSHFHLRQRRVTDPQWKPFAASIAKRTGAAVIPAFVNGHNGLWFQLAGVLHPRLRTALLPREMLNKSGTSVRVTLGAPVSPSRLKSFGSSLDSTSYLRARTYMLGDLGPAGLDSRRALPGRPPSRGGAPVTGPVPPALLEAEVDALGPDRKLARIGSLCVTFAAAEQIPWTLREIGRLREITFRAAGEGTGRATDLDRFDEHYGHLFLWCEKRREVVGAYRVARVDEVLARHGPSGLYTYTLFRYRRAFLDELVDAVELGRSFIRAEHQRSHVPLALLWKGIGRLIAETPRYHRLFGPVSISNDYHPVSRQFMVDFLRVHSFESRLARQVKPRTGFRPANRPSRHVRELARMGDLDTASDVIDQIEQGRRGVPILLRQYLKLGGTLVGFNRDAEFGDALDGLIMVDLLETFPRMLERYMGKQESASFRAFHARTRPDLREAS